MYAGVGPRLPAPSAPRTALPGWRPAVDLGVVGRGFLRRLRGPPEFEGTRPTVRRLINLWRVSWQWRRYRTSLASYPLRLCIEASGACNLACPHCFTGAGEGGRPRAMLSLAFFRRLLDELADHLWQIEFHNWGEPLLNKNLPTMIAEARARGLSTVFCTNFSLPFDAAHAERLVGSGLSVLGVSIDGASQNGYEQYRVGGQLDLVLRNCRLMVDARRRLRSRTPRIIWSYHVFGHNRDEVDTARRMAAGMGIDFHASRGRVFGQDWDPDERSMPHEHTEPVPCYTLYHTAVVYADGSVAPCRGSFYREDDMGRIATDGGSGVATFREVWNGERFRLAREFFARPDAAPHEAEHICHACPAKIDHEHYVAGLMLGGTKEQWQPRFNSHERYNYFWNRRLFHGAAVAAVRAGRR
jgi:pyruvate-formate lyase-activating enzyme